MGTLLFCGFTVALALAAPAAVEVELSRSSARPGDIVELRAHFTSSTPADFRLEIPRFAHLHTVAIAQEPIRYNGQVYTAATRWVFQPLQSGILDLNGLEAIVQQGASTLETPVAPVRIEVLPYPGASDGDEPEPLPDPVAAGDSGLWRYALFGITGAAVAVVMAVAGMRRRRRLQPTGPQGPEPPCLEAVLAMLEGGHDPRGGIIRLLEAEGPRLDPALRDCLEQAAYGRSFDRDATRQSLRRALKI